ncbi:MAG: excinuclease ABC subunit UvrC [Proteobacteria bacterium]|nr:excinuclease ABC subunit UvrC [Pseudomonadota bacterium]
MIDETIINSLPESSGVYTFRDKEQNIIYIGKAKNIKDRVRSYFRESEKDPKTSRLVSNIENIEIMLTGSEKEAFLLENNLIKENSPKYNINLKDDKTYVSLKLTVKETFPALYITRDIKDDGALYFGPYPHARDVKDVMKLVQTVYAIRRCKDTVFRKRKRACMLFELEKCLGPCAGHTDQQTYRKVVDELVDLLSGKDEKLLKELQRRIKETSENWNFEEAKQLKERYLAIKGMVEKQRVHEHLGRNRDVWAFLEGDHGVKIVLLTFRKGVLVSKKHFKESLMKVAYEEAISSFLFQYYNTRPIPEEIILSEDIEDRHFLEKHLKERKKGVVSIYGPRSRLSKEIIPLAIENLLEPEALDLGDAFKRSLHLRKAPERIEIYDISHLFGANPTGVMVVFEAFKTYKKGYRVFHIRSAPSMDDVAAMAEVLKRRLTDEKIGPLPDLFIVDGGKGQLSAATKALRGQNIDRDVIGIAKGERRRGMDDLIYAPNRKNPLVLPRVSPVFKEIVKMRDEAHRFAVTSHRKWKRKEDLQ